VRDLELSGAELKRMLRQTGDKLGDWLDTLPDQPTSRLAGSNKLAARLDEPCPTEPTGFTHLLSQVVDHITPISLNTASGGYLAFIPGGGLPQSAVADLISGVTNRYTGLWRPAPGWVQLEVSVLRWMCQWIGYGPESGGVLTSGGSLANLSALVAARDAGAQVVYTTSLAHHCVAKAAHIVGLPLVELPMDADFRLRPETIPERPGVVVASAGTTAVGSVDPLDALADVCQAGGHWLHVDGAYGGCFVLTERGRAVLRGIERADSVVLDPHKGLFLPYGTGALLVRERAKLAAAFQSSASYLPEPGAHDLHWDFTDLGPELSRPARGLRLWLPLKLHGVGAWERALDEKLDLALQARDRLAAMPGIELVTDCELSLFAFRVNDSDTDTRRLLSRVNERQRVFLTGATVPGHGFVGRVCVLSFRTHQAQIDALSEDVERALRAT
jgi:aromatic-L-amino-acid decarboxylase